MNVKYINNCTGMEGLNFVVFFSRKEYINRFYDFLEIHKKKLESSFAKQVMKLHTYKSSRKSMCLKNWL